MKRLLVICDCHALRTLCSTSGRQAFPAAEGGVEVRGEDRDHGGLGPPAGAAPHRPVEERAATSWTRGEGGGGERGQRCRRRQELLNARCPTTYSARVTNTSLLIIYLPCCLYTSFMLSLITAVQTIVKFKQPRSTMRRPRRTCVYGKGDTTAAGRSSTTSKTVRIGIRGQAKL